jgi:hypothetical protein
VIWEMKFVHADPRVRGDLELRIDLDALLDSVLVLVGSQVLHDLFQSS